MPPIEEGYTSEGLAEMLNVSRQAIWKRARNENWFCTQRSERLGGNLYPYTNLPADVKAAIARHLAAAQPKPSPGDQAIPEWSRRIGLARFQIVAAWRTFCHHKPGQRINKTELTSAFLLAYNSNQLAIGAYEIIGRVQKSSLYNWDASLRASGDDYHALCDRRGKWDKGGPKGLGQLSPETQRIFLSMWLTPNQPSVQLAYTGLETLLGDLNQEPPSLASIYRFAKRYEETCHDVVVMMREGEKALNDKVLPYIRRDRNLLKVGDCLFADGHTLNFECEHPETGKPFRPTLLLWFDWKSGMPVGWEFMPTENIITVASALRMAIRRLGQIPRVVYLDNGKAFKAKYFTETNPDLNLLSGLYARLGIATQFATPYRGQVKTIERFFGTMNEQFSRLMPSYCGRDIADKPAWRRRNEKFHRKRHERQDYVPTLAEAANLFAAYVEWFGHQPHPDEKKLTGQEIFEAGRGPGVDLADLDREFLWSREVSPDRCGFVLAKTRYVSDILMGLKQKVIVRFAWSDLSEVYLFDQQGRSLGVARPQEKVHPLASKFGTEHDQAIVAEANRRRNALKKATLQEVRTLEGDLAEAPGFAALPYSYRPERVERLQIEGSADPVVSEAEKAEVEAITSAALASNHKLKFKKPAAFASRLKKYDWLYTSCMDGYEPEDDEIAFMKDYETSAEYLECAKPRYDQLRAAFGPLPQFGGRDGDSV